ncbi:MAG: glycoside hydrolase family 9 protein, partial [Elusimicrobiales bacterium]|nr:glycoside hydrolase family 9 protein [Elusimicrobiales bacterium]
MIRLNQAGYLPGDSYKTAIISGISGNFQVCDVNNISNVLFFSSVSFLGTDTITGENLYLADFSSFTQPGRYVIKIGNEISFPFEIKEDLYNKVLYYAVRIFGANRCGPYNSWLHKPCHLKDGSKRGTGKEGSLAGGWHDCGDYVKFGLTTSFAAIFLLFTYEVLSDRFGDYYGMSYDGDYLSPRPDGVPDIINEVKVYTDYILNLYNASVEDGLISQNRMYYQVGDGDKDHNYWHLPEYQDDMPPNYGGAPRDIWDDIGPDIASRFAAALALMGKIYKSYDESYSNKCINAAREIYKLAKNVYGISGKNTGLKSYYPTNSTPNDSLAFAALQLYRATSEETYLEDTKYWMRIKQEWSFRTHWYLCYSAIHPMVLYHYYPFAPTADSGSYGTAVVTKQECINWIKEDAKRVSADLYGRRASYAWGTCRYIASVGCTALLAYLLDPNDKEMLKIAKEQIDWLFGRNQFGMSFIIGNKKEGWLTRYPQHPHHAAANPEGQNVLYSIKYDFVELTGALIGGPLQHTSFDDRWDNYKETEAGVDYWAPLVLLSAYFAKPASEVIDMKPKIWFSNLKNGTTLYGLVDIEVIGQDDKGVTKIELYLNSKKVYEVINSTSLIYKWDTTQEQNGSYLIRAVAHDTRNQMAEITLNLFVYNISTYSLTVSVSPSSGGSVSKNPDKAAYT